MRLYRRIDVWKRLGTDRAVRYLCFEDVERHCFCVQSADFFYLPVDDDQLRQHARQLVELFIETDPGERAGCFGSLREAIRRHDADFSE